MQLEQNDRCIKFTCYCANNQYILQLPNNIEDYVSDPNIVQHIYHSLSPCPFFTVTYPTVESFGQALIILLEELNIQLTNQE